MPYIKEVEREKFNKVLQEIENIFARNTKNAGELNYLISSICKLIIKSYGENYNNYNEIIGVLESAKLELYRKQIASYEEKKIKENGDVK